jgi:hypothetical protein
MGVWVHACMGRLTFSASDQAAPLAPVLLGGLGSVSDIVFVDLGCLVVCGGIVLGCGIGREGGREGGGGYQHEVRVGRYPSSHLHLECVVM